MKRIRSWWLIAENFCGRLSTPQIDIARADREIEALLHGSRIWCLGAAWSAAIHRAWLDSWTRRLLVREDFQA